MSSFRVHSEIRQRALEGYVEPSAEKQDQFIYKMEEIFAICRARLPDDWDTFEHFERIVRCKLEGTSSPGYPLCREKPTIAEWLGGSVQYPSPQRLSLLWTMVVSVFEGTYEHIWRCFVKAEPHKKQKAAQGRWRLIMMSSLPVQVAWHMAVGHLESRILAKMGNHPLRHGTMYFGGGWRRFREELLLAGRVWNSDKSGWDWNSPGWPYVCCKKLRKRLTVGASDKWLELIDRLYEDAFFRKKVILPDGWIVQQAQGGLMPSGAVTTISDNGFSQLFLDLCACDLTGEPYSDAIATGDDVAQRIPKDADAYVAALQQSGCIVKEFSVGTEFMGFELAESGFKPKYLGKHLTNFCHQKEEFLSETLEGYLRIYAYDDDAFSFWYSMIEILNLDVARFRSREYYRYFAGNPEALETWSVKPARFLDAVVSDGVCSSG